MKKYIPIFLILVGSFTSVYADWASFDIPGATSTSIHAVDGDTYIGHYINDTGKHNFIYENQEWKSIHIPGSIHTEITGIEGDAVVGNYEYNEGMLGFFKFKPWSNNGWWQTDSFKISGVDRDILLGNYVLRNGERTGTLLYNTGLLDSVQVNGNPLTYLTDLYGETLVGYYLGDNSAYGCIYNNFIGDQYDGSDDWDKYDVLDTGWTIFNIPGSDYTYINAIDNDLIVGHYVDKETGYDHGFIYDGLDWTAFDIPGSISTTINDIDGDKIVGSYMVSPDEYHGFVYTIPEPSSLLFLSLGGLVFLRKRK